MSEVINVALWLIVGWLSICTMIAVSEWFQDDDRTPRIPRL